MKFYRDQVTFIMGSQARRHWEIWGASAPRFLQINFFISLFKK